MERIVVGVDGSPGGRRALEWAALDARRRGAALELVVAWHPAYGLEYAYGFGTGGADIDPLEVQAKQLLEDALEGIDTTGLTIEQTVVCSTAARALLDRAEHAALVVVGSRGLGGFTGLLLGSVSQQVVHHATCPVVVVPDRG
jgi:nucleotide-binding universal stress UspA family protein